MSNQDQENDTQPSSGMADHLQRYKNHVNNLKRGKSSGISAAFGRATDLLPPELFEVKPPTVKPVSALPKDLHEPANTEERHHTNLRETVEELVESCLDEREEAIGTIINMPDGKASVDSVVVENGQRMFVLNNGKVIDEQAFNVLAEKNSLLGTSESLHEAGEYKAAEDDDATAYGSDYGELKSDESNWDEGWTELSVDTVFGAKLWDIHYDGTDVRSVMMADGSSIRRAEGRPEFILALRTDSELTFAFFILDGLIVDPSTGNIYVEANEGAYSAAFLNNGWQLHQYRKHDGTETYYATEPESADNERTTCEVLNLSLDVTVGEVSYDALDGSASTTLKSRVL